MTANELYRQTLERLQVAADGEPALPGDVQLLTKRYRRIFELLMSKELAEWDVEEEIPDDAGLAMVMILAAHSAEEFQVPEPRKSALKAEGLLDLPVPSLGERMLIKRRGKRYISQPIRTDYF